MATGRRQPVVAAPFPAPYSRVFNPVRQARKFDPHGVYLRRWLPELADVSIDPLHEPWADPGVAKRTGYPLPMLDLAVSRRQALGAYASWRRLE
ncbi:FAD-binding domain-containing protein [Dyella sp.]|uniref:FAD-binding domain-containing protein n=1 Tax=Dyella sp. TaxID=1869338 RepID=UPI002FDA1C84